MGRGIEIARVDAPEHAAMMEDLKEQLLLVFLKRLGGEAEVPASEIDATGGYNMTLSLDTVTRVFHFKLEKKQ